MNNKIKAIYDLKDTTYRYIILKIVELNDLKEMYESSMLLAEDHSKDTEDYVFFYNNHLHQLDQYLKLKQSVYEYCNSKLNLTNNKIQELITYVKDNFQLSD